MWPSREPGEIFFFLPLSHKGVAAFKMTGLWSLFGREDAGKSPRLLVAQGVGSS